MRASRSYIPCAALRKSIFFKVGSRYLGAENSPVSSPEPYTVQTNIFYNLTGGTAKMI